MTGALAFTGGMAVADGTSAEEGRQLVEAWAMTSVKERLLEHVSDLTDRRYRAEWQQTDNDSWFSELTVAEE